MQQLQNDSKLQQREENFHAVIGNSGVTIVHRDKEEGEDKLELQSKIKALIPVAKKRRMDLNIRMGDGTNQRKSFVQTVENETPENMYR